MKTVTITLELTPEEVIAVMAIIKPAKVLTGPNHCLEVDLPTEQTKCVLEAPEDTPVIVKPTAGKTTKMPGFGRNQQQVDTHAASENQRIVKAEEDEEAKKKRTAIRIEKQAVKENELAIKQKIQETAEQEVDAIKSADILPILKAKDLIPPWLL